MAVGERDDGATAAPNAATLYLFGDDEQVQRGGALGIRDADPKPQQGP